MQGELTLQRAGKRRGAGSMVWALHTVYFSSSVRGSATPALHHVHLSTTTDTCANTKRMYPVGSAKDPAFPTFQQAKQCTLSGHLSPTSLPLLHCLAAVLRLEHENIYMHRHATGVAMRSTEVAMQASKEASSDGNGGKSKQSGECQMPATSATPTLLKKGASWANQRANRAQITNWNSRWGTANGRHTHTQNTLQQQEQNGGEESQKEVKKPE